MFIEIPANKRSISKRKLIFGIGINDATYQTSPKIYGKQTICPFYSRWIGMLMRCYSKKYQIKQPTYIGCSVCNNWLTFSNFKSWMVKQCWQGKDIDKDIKFTGNKIYSPNTCIFVTKEINTLLNDRAAARGEWPQGVCFNKKLKKFQSSCRASSKRVHLGLFLTPKKASEEYKKFKSKLILSIAEKQEQPLKGYLIRISEEFKS